MSTKCKIMIEEVIKAEYLVPTDGWWSKSDHPVYHFKLSGHKFTYSADSTPKAAYTRDKTSKAIKNSLIRKSVQWGYIKDASEFEAKFMKG